jgi:transporter family protein
VELWFVLASLCALLWGLAGVFAKLSTPKLGVARIAYLIVIIESVMYFAGFYCWHENMTISLEYGALAAVSALVGITAYLCFFESLMTGQVASVGTISAAFPALTVIGAVIFLSETLTVIQLVGLAAIISGVVGLSYEWKRGAPDAAHAIPRRSLFFALLAFALWGFWSLTSKIVVNKIGPGNVFGFYAISSFAVPFLYGGIQKIRSSSMNTEKPASKVWAFGAMSLALNVSGTFAFSFALKVGLASLVVPISSAYPLVTVTLALLLLGEKLNHPQLIALAFVIIGLIIIGSIG